MFTQISKREIAKLTFFLILKKSTNATFFIRYSKYAYNKLAPGN